MNEIGSSAIPIGGAEFGDSVLEESPSTTSANLVEPRGLTIADLLALTVGFSWAFAMHGPMNFRHMEYAWSGFSPWVASLLSVESVADLVPIGVLPALLWRQVRYRRMPFPAEWLAIVLAVGAGAAFPFLILVSLLEWSFEVTGIKDILPLYAMRGMSGAPGPLVAAWGLLFLISGAVLLSMFRRFPPICRTVWICGLLGVYQAICVPYWRVNAHWIGQSDLLHYIVIFTSIHLPMAIAAMSVVRQRIVNRDRPWIWTESVTAFVFMVGLGSGLIARFEARWFLLAHATVLLMGLGLSIVTERLWRRYWA